MIEIPLFRTIFKRKSKTVKFVVHKEFKHDHVTVFRKIKRIREFRGPRIRRFVLRDTEREKFIFIHDGKNHGLSVIIE